MKNLIIIFLLSLSVSVFAQDQIRLDGNTYIDITDLSEYKPGHDAGTRVYKHSNFSSNSYYLHRVSNTWKQTWEEGGGGEYVMGYWIHKSNSITLPCFGIYEGYNPFIHEPSGNYRVYRVYEGDCTDEPVYNFITAAESNPNFLTLPGNLPDSAPENPSNGSMYYDPVSGKIKVFLLGDWKVIVTAEDDDD